MKKTLYQRDKHELWQVQQMVSTVCWMIILLKGSLETALTACHKEFKAILTRSEQAMEDWLASIINDPLYQAISEMLGTRSYQLVEFKDLFGNVIMLTVCSYHVTYAFQSESTLCSCLNVKELFAWIRCKIWSLSDCNWTRTHNHFVYK